MPPLSSWPLGEYTAATFRRSEGAGWAVLPSLFDPALDDVKIAGRTCAVKWSKRRLTNSGQAVPAGRAGGPAQPVILLTGRTGLFDQCASQAGLHDWNVQPARWSNTPVWPVSQVTGREGPPAQPVGTARPVLVKHFSDCYFQVVIAGSVQLILRAT
ncbi:hypothetical protein PCANC_13300 [Puccinia coronata f. sp. avenae]|uniref:Uncharacterized protein n=1 Tax=Puccinia coronata f. sp. avenae TaxID=200324 RepID=A0A2N5SZH3_9BASI|nr:hypothetical protein PCANC_13300 [Puccinia coronata f. sp. avenae]